MEREREGGRERENIEEKKWKDCNIRSLVKISKSEREHKMNQM